MQSARNTNFLNLTANKLAEAFQQLRESDHADGSSLPQPPLGALSGIPIVGIVEHIAGPLALGTLTSEGAISVSIEPRSGDPARKYLSHECFSTLHAGKMSVAMDLKTDPNYPKVLREACIIIDNRSKRARDNDAALQQFLKDPQKSNRVIYCYISGFPGMDESKPGNDVIVQASTGMAFANAPEEDKPLKVGFMLLDFATADWTVIAIQARLIEMLRGIPIEVEVDKVIPVHVNMATVAARFLSLPYLDALQGRRVKQRTWNQDSSISIFSFFKTRDERNLAIGTLTDAGFKVFCDQVIFRPDLSSRFPTNELRLNNNAFIHEEIQKFLATQDLDYWVKALSSLNIPHAAVERVEDAVKKPYAPLLFSKTKDGTPIIARPDGRYPLLDPAPTLDQHGKILGPLLQRSEDLRLKAEKKPTQKAPQRQKASFTQMKKRIVFLQNENKELRQEIRGLKKSTLDASDANTRYTHYKSGRVSPTSPSSMYGKTLTAPSSAPLEKQVINKLTPG